MSGGEDEVERSRGPKLRLVSDSSDSRETRKGAQPVADHGEEAEEASGEDEVLTPKSDELHEQNLRVLEALLFASSSSMTASKLAEALPPGEDPIPLLMELQQQYRDRGINLVRVAGRWAFRTADDLGYLLKREVVDERRLSKAALETLSIIAYHQPVTRAEIEEIRGVSTSAGTLDILLESEWIKPRGRRRAPGRPVTYGTTEQFLEHFGLDSVADLPGLGELRGAGLLSSQLPPDFVVPQPTDIAALMPDELPLEDDEEQSEFNLDEDGVDFDADASPGEDEVLEASEEPKTTDAGPAASGDQKA